MNLIDYTLKLTEEDYHNMPAWSYSIISKYAKEGFAALATLEERTAPTPSMEFGSLFDSILTKGKKTLDDYVVFDKDVPSAEKKVIDYLIDNNIIANSLTEITREEYTKATEACEYYLKWGLDARMKHIYEYEDYYQVAKSKKKIVSKLDWEDAIEMARVFRQDKYLQNLFGVKNTEDIEYIYQAQFATEMILPSNRVVNVKIMPDLLKINHKEKTIQPVDLKTSTIPAWNFKENFLKFRYDLQASVYTDVLRKIISTCDDVKDYTILPYLFTDISRSDKVPVTYLYDQTSEEQANGFTMTIGEKTYSYKHWTTLLDEIINYKETEAKVPSYITTEGPNDILTIINIK